MNANIKSALRTSEERHLFLLKLSDALRPFADPLEIQQAAIRQMGEYLGVDRAAYGEMRSDDQIMEVSRDWTSPGTPSIAGAYRVDDFGFFSVELRQGKPAVMEDVLSDPTISPEMYEKTWKVIGVRSAIAYALIKQGRLIASIFIHGKEPRRWSEDEVSLVVEIGERTWAAVERARAEAALRESEDRFRNQTAELRAVLESMSDAVYIGNREGITLANQAALEQLGYATREELNRNVGILSFEIQNRDLETGLRIPDEDLPFVRALNGERIVREVLVRHRATGEDRVVRCAASPIKIDGHLIGAVAVNSDITRERQADAALRESEKLAAVGRLASSIAHEINNPLEAMTNLIYLASGASDSVATKMYLEQAKVELERISHVTSETLRFHRQTKEATAVDLSTVLESVVALHEGRLRSGLISVNRRYFPHTPLLCFANELRQVAANLIGNAIDAMNSKMPRTLFLRVRAAHDPATGEEGVRFTIADTGEGIHPATRERIFEPFFTTKEHTGTGLGLWVTQTILDKHKGKIGLRSKPGSGTVFSIFLPNRSKTRH